MYGAIATPDNAVNQRAVIEAFLAAARQGDVKGLLGLLAPDVIRRADYVARDEGTATELRGADAVAKEIAANRNRAAFASVLLVDGALGAVVAPLGRLRFVLRFTLTDERISTFEAVGARESLDSLELRLLPS